jgi:hypothetical protein
MTIRQAKARGTVRPESCCRASGAGACAKHKPNVALEVRKGGKWVHLGVLTPEHEWVLPALGRRRRKALERTLAATNDKEAV